MRALVALSVLVALLGAAAACCWWAYSAFRSRGSAAASAREQSQARARLSAAAAEDADHARRAAQSLYDALMAGSTSAVRASTSGRARQLAAEMVRAVRADKVDGFTVLGVTRAGDVFTVRAYEILGNDRFRRVTLTLGISRISRRSATPGAEFVTTDVVRERATSDIPPK